MKQNYSANVLHSPRDTSGESTALGIAADTGLAAKALRSISGKPGPKATP